MPAFKPFPLVPDVRSRAGEPYRFEVQSESRPNVWHLVDLEECGFNGACGCERFLFHCLPKLKEDRRENRPPRFRRCLHIRRALVFLAEVIVRHHVLNGGKRT